MSMKKIYLPIDQKSLYYNIKNDNRAGHTATVATPIKQGNSLNEDLNKIFQIDGIVGFQYKDGLMREFLKNSKSKNKILDAFVFDNISFNNIPIITSKQFCMYIKEEIDPNKAQYGRIKLHYPMTLSYEDEDISISNKEILDSISGKINNAAFIVEGFDYDFTSRVLNFRIMIVGENQVPYSKVFIKEKGAGSKFATFFSEDYDDYDMEIISLRKNINKDIGPKEFTEIISQNRNLAIEIVNKYLTEKGFEDIRCMRQIYPYSIYDFQYRDKGENIKYIMLYFTSTNLMYFNIKQSRLSFLDSFSDNTEVFLITNINNNPKINILNLQDVFEMKKIIKSFMIIKE